MILHMTSRISFKALFLSLMVLIGLSLVQPDNSFAQVATPIRTVTVLPGTCSGGTPGQSTDAVVLVAGGIGQFYFCSAPDTWSAAGGAFGVQYNFPGSYVMNQGTNGQQDAVQTFVVDQYHSSFQLGTAGQAPGFAQTGEMWIGPPGLTSNIPHIFYQISESNFGVLTTADFAQDLANGAVGFGPICLQTNCILVAPFLGDFVANSGTFNLSTGDYLSLGPGLALAVKGSVTSGAFFPAENVIQTSTGASGTLIGAPVASSPMLLQNSVVGSPDNSHTWVGQTTGAVYTPTTVPSTPYCLASGQAGFIKICYGSDNRLQSNMNNVGYSDFALFSDLPAQIINPPTSVLDEVPLEYATGTSATQSGSLGSQTIVATTPASTTWWEISFSEFQVAVGTSCTGNTTVVNKLTYTDPRASGPVTLSINVPQVITNGTANVPFTCGQAAGQSCGSFTFETASGTSIAISTTYTAGSGCSPSPTYQVSYLLKKL